MQTCGMCKGQKKIMPLGMINKECHTCNGIGYTVGNPVQTVTDDVPVDIVPVKIRRKPGRRPKVRENVLQA